VASGHASLLAVGDLVKETGTSDTAGLAQVDAAAAAGLITGVIVAIDPNFSALETKGLAAGTAGTVKVAVDPNTTMLAESSAAVAITDVGANADIVATAATASGGLVNSNMTVNTAAPGSATAQMRIIGLPDGAGGAGTTMLVRINESTVKGVVGV
jgi:hypothetical protein